VFPKHVSANFWLPQVVWQGVPHRRAGHSESPPGKCATPVKLEHTV